MPLLVVMFFEYEPRLCGLRFWLLLRNRPESVPQVLQV